MEHVPVRAAGGVVWRQGASGIEVVLICDRYKTWTLPKGHLDAGETEETAALREVTEETGVRAEPGPLIERIGYTVTSRRGQQYYKTVAFFLLRATSDQLVVDTHEGISDIAWVPLDEAMQRVGYRQLARVLARAKDLLQRA